MPTSSKEAEIAEASMFFCADHSKTNLLYREISGVGTLILHLHRGTDHSKIVLLYLHFIRVRKVFMNPQVRDRLSFVSLIWIPFRSRRHMASRREQTSKIFITTLFRNILTLLTTLLPKWSRGRGTEWRSSTIWPFQTRWPIWTNVTTHNNVSHWVICFISSYVS